MISVIELKRFIAGIGVLGFIVGEFHHEKKSCPIILLEVDKNLKVGFHHIILLFSLPIYLGIESSEKSSLNA